MKSSKTLIIFFVISYIFSAAQMMSVKRWRKTERDSLDNGLLLLDEKYYLPAVPIFEGLLKNHPNEDFLKYSFAKSALYRADKHALAYKYLTEVYEKNKKIPEISYEMALAAHYNYKFDDAQQFVTQFLANRKLPAEAKKNALLLQKNIANAKFHYANPTKAKISNLGSAINTAADEYVPAITADESSMIFTYAGPKSVGGLQNAYLQEDLTSGVYMEDIYMSYRKNGTFQPAIALDSLNTTGPDAPVSMSADGRVLFIYQDLEDTHGDLYQSFLNGEHFSRPQKLKGKVNSYSWDGHCALSPDGRTLYFSSERSGGFGGRDIYRASLGADSSWTNVVNLGDSVNTDLDDDAPFIHADGVTLYFSSKGHGSMGGYDVFRTRLNTADSSFKQVEHLGYPINSPSDDTYFVLAANGKTGYYSSTRTDGKGMKDIYMVEPAFAGASPAVCLVKGVISSSKIPVQAGIRVEVTSAENRLFNSFVSNSATGRYLLSLPAGAVYNVVYTYSNFPEQTFVVNTQTATGYKELSRNVDFTAAEEPVAIVPAKNTGALAAANSASFAMRPDKEGFMPVSKLQAKTIRYIERYGDAEAPGVEFMVQITALKNTGKYYFPKLAKYGRIEKMKLGDGFTRLMLGGSFKSMKKAFALNKKVVTSGYPDAFVVAFYKGKRVQYEELEKLGLLKAK